MKTIYRIKYTYTLNDNTTHETGRIWHYGEMPETEITQYTWEEACNALEYYWERRIFSKKHHMRLQYTTTWVNEEDFETAFEIRTCESISWQYSIKELAEHLSANEFIDWCKDNGITSVNI